jgi:DNA modification methylase
MTVTILKGDCREVLRGLPADSVHCCVTSPPYFGLRDYGMAGQIGLEPTPDAFVEQMVAVFGDVRRVLRADGTCWLNLGDSYASQGGPEPAQTKWQVDGASSTQNAGRSRTTMGMKPKDLIGIPWRVAFALQADGWYLRQDIIWSKPNPMPESVRDRCTKAHEYLFLLSKSERYHYDADAIRQEPTGRTDPIRSFSKGSLGNHTPNYQLDASVGANKRSVWTVSTEAYADAHFATFPPALIEPCILAGCPKGGIVLDPFGGAGTTGLVADRLGRDAILIELNPEYAAMAERRIRGDAPLFADVRG